MQAQLILYFPAFGGDIGGRAAEAERFMNTVKKPVSKKYFILAAVALVLIISLVGAILIGSAERSGSISDELKDAVLHEEKKINLFGWAVNPAAISAMIVTGVLLLAAILIRIFAVPRFKDVPGKFQLCIESLVSFFDGMAKGSSPHSNNILGCYIFAAGCYICFGTLFELFGIQFVAVNGYPVSLPAPLSDINAAIAMGCLSYLFIMGGGIATNGLRGFGRAIKEFSLPVSMSFRLFGALLSGLLVTELVYYTISLSIVLPVAVGVLFTLLHAVIQAYVLVMLTATYYGEVTEPPVKKAKKLRKSKTAEAAAA